MQNPPNLVADELGRPRSSLRHPTWCALRYCVRLTPRCLVGLTVHAYPTEAGDPELEVRVIPCGFREPDRVVSRETCVSVEV